VKKKGGKPGQGWPGLRAAQTSVFIRSAHLRYSDCVAWARGKAIAASRQAALEENGILAFV